MESSPSRKARILVPADTPSEGETEPRALFREVRDRSARSTHRDGEDGQSNGHDEAAQRGVLQGLVMGQRGAVRSQQ